MWCTAQGSLPGPILYWGQKMRKPSNTVPCLYSFHWTIILLFAIYSCIEHWVEINHWVTPVVVINVGNIAIKILLKHYVAYVTQIHSAMKKEKNRMVDNITGNIQEIFNEEIIFIEKISKFPLMSMGVLTPRLCILDGVAHLPIDISHTQSFGTLGQLCPVKNSIGAHRGAFKISESLLNSFW